MSGQETLDERHGLLTPLPQQLPRLDKFLKRTGWWEVSVADPASLVRSLVEISDGARTQQRQTSAQRVQVLNYGVGFRQPDVEALLPVSPVTCLQILPRVPRVRSVKEPSVLEVNTAQAMFASHACYSNMFSEEIDGLVQQHISAAKIGENAFTLWHRQYDDLFYDMIMNQKPRQ